MSDIEVKVEEPVQTPVEPVVIKPLIEQISEIPMGAGAWNAQKTVVALYRKGMYIYLNKWLKERKYITRFKRNMNISEMFSAAYSKVISGVVGELLSICFADAPEDSVSWEKIRGVYEYNITLRLPNSDEAVTAIKERLQIDPHNLFAFYDYQFRAGQAVLINIQYRRLNHLLEKFTDTTISLETFFSELLRLVNVWRGSYGLDHVTIREPVALTRAALRNQALEETVEAVEEQTATEAVVEQMIPDFTEVEE